MLQRIIKITAGLLIDLAIIWCLCKLMLIFISINPLLCFFILCIFYTLFACFNHWITPGIKLAGNLKKKRAALTEISVGKLFHASFLDWFLIFSFTLLINILLRQFLFVDTIVLFTIVAPCYYIFSFLFFRQTFGYCFCGIELAHKQTNKRLNIPVFKRELFKFGISAWLPFGLLRLFHIEISYNNALLVLLLNSIVLLFYYTAKGEAWWNTIAKTQAQKRTVFPKFRKLILACFAGFAAITYVVFLACNNYNNPSSHKLLGFNVPFKKVEYPNNCKVKPYTAFLKENAQEAKDYLLGLFEKYDIVILCENLHPEDTQWDLIYEVISDSLFVKNVGHIFTEYGAARDQCRVDSFMCTSFADDTALSKATATLMNYHSGNFYRFMKKLHQFNRTLPDSLKIREHFTDISGWKYLTSAYYDTCLGIKNK